MIKAIHIIDSLEPGGAERIFITLVNLLSDKGCSTSCMTLLSKGSLAREIHSEIRFVEINRSNKFNIITMLRIHRILKEYTIIHCHLRHVFRYIKVIKIIFFARYKLILHDHSGDTSQSNTLRLNLGILFRPDYYIGVSNKQIEWAQNFLKLPKDRIFKLTNVIIGSKTLSSGDNHVKKSDLVIVGNINPIKNQILAVRIAKKLNLTLNIIGRNTDNHYYNALIQEIGPSYQGIDIYEHIINACDYIPNSKLGLCISTFESGPLVLMEYLSCGLPFVSFRTGAVVEKILPYYPEFILESFDINKWCERIGEVYSKSYKKSDLQQVYKDNFDPEIFVQTALAIYKQLDKPQHR